jgi:Arc/MetJ-type ribon-helix-helix transcriptional regulator
MGRKNMDKHIAVSAKLPEDVYKELKLRIPEGERSNFIRDAITEKLEKTPRADKILELDQKISKLEAELAHIKRYLTELEVLTFEKDKINPHTFCLDEIDHKIVDYIENYKGATTPELAEQLKTNRWQMLNRLKRIQKRSRNQLGKPVIEYYAGERSGKKKAWWINRELVEET